MKTYINHPFSKLTPENRGKKNAWGFGYSNQRNSGNYGTSSLSFFKGALLFTVFFILIVGNVWSQNSNIQISSAATSNGSWSGGIAGPYTFTPIADNAVVNTADIQNRLIGTGFTANNVTIVTARAGSGQPGNVTMALGATITAATTTATQHTFSINAGGSISIGQAINLTPSAGAPNATRPGTNISITANQAISISAAITSNGNLRGNGPGGAGGNITLSSTSRTVSITSTGAITANGSGAIGGNNNGGNGGNISISGTGITIEGNLTSLGGAQSGSGTVGTAGNFTFTNSATAVTTGGGNNDGQIAGIISGGSVTKNGIGTLLLAGLNTYRGLTTINSGTVRLGASGGGTNTTLGTIGGGTSVASGAALDLNGFTLGTTEPLLLNGTGISNYGALTNSSSTAATYSGLLTLGSACSIVSPAGNIVISNPGTITGATFGLTLGGTATGSSIASIIGTTSGTLTKTGTGTWTLSGSNTYTGLTSVKGGTLRAGVNNALASGDLSVNGGAYDLATFSDAIGAVTLISGSIAGTTGVLTGTSYTVQSGTLSAILAGSAGLTKTTAGTVTLSGLNTYTGTTQIAAGTLQLGASGVLPNALVSLEGGTLSTGATVGFSEPAGTLGLTASSKIRLGKGTHNINFSASNSVSWTGSKTLTITGWTGTAGASGTEGKIFFGANATGLTAGQLAQINFEGYSPGAIMLPDGEIVPSAVVPLVSSATTASSTFGTASIYTITASNLPTSFNASGIPTGMTINTSTGVITISATTPAGVYTITISGTNISGTGSTTLTYTVKRAVLTITAVNQAVCFAIPVATVIAAGTSTISGFVNLETASVILGTVTYTTTYIASTPAGTVGVTITPVVSGLTSSNYNFSAVSGTIAINDIPVAITSPNFTTNESRCISTSPGFNALSVQAGTGFSYQWYRNTSGTINPTLDASVGTNSNRYTPPSDGSAPSPSRYYVVVSSTTSCGTASTYSLSGVFIVNPLPLVSFVTQPAVGNYCADTNITYSTQSGQSNYIWSIPGSAGTDYTIISGGTSATNTVVISWLTAGNKSVSVNYTDAQSCGAPSPANSNIITIQKNTVTQVSGLFPSVCLSNPNEFALNPLITHQTTLATGIGAATGLPDGLKANWSANQITISGTLNSSSVIPGVYNYSIPLTGGCGKNVNATGFIEVTPNYSLTSIKSVGPSLLGGKASVTISGPVSGLPNGNYIATYTLGFTNSGSYTTIGFNITNGTGTFTTVDITNQDLTSLIITSIQKTTDKCTVPITNLETYFGTCSATFEETAPFYVPAGVYEITIRVWGGGGKGGASTNTLGGGGGGGGGFTSITIPVSPSQVLNVNVGKGGGKAGNPSPNGQPSYLSASSVSNYKTQSIVFANGGTGGTGAVGGSGGSIDTRNERNSTTGISAVNATTYLGTNGGNGANIGGTGGVGATSNSNNSLPGSPRGGGGGGAMGNGNLGANGGDGIVFISYSCPKADDPCVRVVDDGATTGTTLLEFICTTNWEIPAGLLEFKVVAGAGGGGGGNGRTAGGGGAGGLVTQTVASTSTYGFPQGNSIKITVGQGGQGSSSPLIPGGNGQNTTVTGMGNIEGSPLPPITGIGGGGGGSDSIPQGRSGGSGGGGSYKNNTNTPGSGGIGTPGQGNNGAPGLKNVDNNGNQNAIAGGGGGGVGSLGFLGNPNGNGKSVGGAGGLPRTLNFENLPTIRYFGAGGGGIGTNLNGTDKNAEGSGGIAPNGEKLGGDGNIVLNGSAGFGKINTGSGGGGAFGIGGNGGSGVVYISFFNLRILEVEYQYFKAAYDPQNRTGDLKWATSKEWGNSHFEIEHAINDTRTWRKIGEIAGKGYSNVPVDYSFTDLNLPAAGGNIFYRLKQVNIDDDFSYSLTRAIQIEAVDGSSPWIAYPNPSSMGSSINVSLLERSGYDDEPIQIRISDERGIFELYSVSSPEEVSAVVNSYLEHARPGMHILQLIGENKSEQLKLIRK